MENEVGPNEFEEAGKDRVGELWAMKSGLSRGRVNENGREWDEERGEPRLLPILPKFKDTATFS